MLTFIGAVNVILMGAAIAVAVRLVNDHKGAVREAGR